MTGAAIVGAFYGLAAVLCGCVSGFFLGGAIGALVSSRPSAALRRLLASALAGYFGYLFSVLSVKLLGG